ATVDISEIRVGCVWALGGAALAGPSLAALTNVGNSTWSFEWSFFLGLLAVAGLSGMLGVRLSTAQETTSPHVIGEVGGALLMAIAYPAAVLLPLMGGSG